MVGMQLGSIFFARVLRLRVLLMPDGRVMLRVVDTSSEKGSGVDLVAERTMGGFARKRKWKEKRERGGPARRLLSSDQSRNLNLLNSYHRPPNQPPYSPEY